MTKILMPRAGMPITSTAAKKPSGALNPPSNRVSMNAPKDPNEQAAYTASVKERLAELSAPSSHANKGMGESREIATKLTSMNQPAQPRSFNPTPPPGSTIDPKMFAEIAKQTPAPAPAPAPMKKGGKVKVKSSYSSGGKVSSASKRGDGCAQRGKTKGRMV